MMDDTKPFGASKVPVRLALALMALGVALALATPADAKSRVQQAVDTVAALTRGCVTTGACAATPATRAFGAATRSMDRLGWEIGRTMSISQHGTVGDPGRYPGIRRR